MGTNGDAIEVTAHVDPPSGPPRKRGGPAQEVQSEAWFRVDQESRTLTWGAEGPNDYSGQLDLAADGDDARTVTVRITTQNPDAEQVRRRLHHAVDAVARSIEARCV